MDRWPTQHHPVEFQIGTIRKFCRLSLLAKFATKASVQNAGILGVVFYALLRGYKSWAEDQDAQIEQPHIVTNCNDNIK